MKKILCAVIAVLAVLAFSKMAKAYPKNIKDIANSAQVVAKPVILNYFSGDEKQYSLVIDSGGHYHFFGRLAKGVDFDKDLKTFGETGNYNSNWPDAQKINNQKLLVWAYGDFPNSNGSWDISLSLPALCNTVPNEDNGTKGELFTCFISASDVASLKIKLADPVTDFNSLWAQTAMEPASDAAKYTSGLLPFKDLADRGKDKDADTIPDYLDNCIDTPNADQADLNNDGTGNACTEVDFSYKAPPDSDGDKWPDTVDNCKDVPNFDQTDSDGDGVGDACTDSDKDGVTDGIDLCPTVKGDSANDGCPLDDVDESAKVGPAISTKDADNGGACSMVPAGHANVLSWLVAAAALIPIGIRRKK